MGIVPERYDTPKDPIRRGANPVSRDLGYSAGQLNYAQVVANQAGIVGATNLTGLSVLVSVGASRRIKITGYCLGRNGTANSGFVLRIQEDATVLQTAQSRNPVANEEATYHAAIVITPSAGNHTYKLTADVTGGGTAQMTASAISPAFILVEDIGAA